ncbi:hypothetical protein Syun_008963 [Stephania yunnanensis]|uniref:Uncharacterized protein n=1 Tax=Stephania yunnanensis TaxID=152371 RepID=A0AAP0PQ58_9MAGN
MGGEREEEGDRRRGRRRSEKRERGTPAPELTSGEFAEAIGGRRDSSVGDCSGATRRPRTHCAAARIGEQRGGCNAQGSSGGVSAAAGAAIGSELTRQQCGAAVLQRGGLAQQRRRSAAWRSEATGWPTAAPATTPARGWTTDSGEAPVTPAVGSLGSADGQRGGWQRRRSDQRRRERERGAGERPAAPARQRQRHGSGGDAVNGAVMRYRPVGCAISTKSRRRSVGTRSRVSVRKSRRERNISRFAISRGR